MIDKVALKKKTTALGFDLVGIARPGEAPHAGRFMDWLRRGFAGEMAYMGRSAAARADPRTRFPWARSIICVAMSYPGPDKSREGEPPAGAPSAGEADATAGATSARTEPHVEDARRAPSIQRGARGRLSCYACGDDYHRVMGERLDRLESFLQANGASRTRAYVDTGPVLERDWAARAGLGWIGKNTALINQSLGSWLYLGSVFVDIVLPPDGPAPDRCGTCADCIEACPTGAIVAPHTVDSRLCLSYLTIELKDALPPRLRELVGHWVFGCDVCQAVCPWNRKVRARPDPAFSPRPGLPDLDLRWALSNPDLLSKLIEGTAVERARGERLFRNLAIAAGNSGDRRLAGALEPRAVTASSRLAEQIGWALERLR